MPKRKRSVDPNTDPETARVYPDVSDVDIIRQLIHFNEVAYHSEKQRLTARLEEAIVNAPQPTTKKDTTL